MPVLEIGEQVLDHVLVGQNQVFLVRLDLRLKHLADAPNTICKDLLLLLELCVNVIVLGKERHEKLPIVIDLFRILILSLFGIVAHLPGFYRLEFLEKGSGRVLVYQGRPRRKSICFQVSVVGLGFNERVFNLLRVFVFLLQLIHRLPSYGLRDLQLQN